MNLHLKAAGIAALVVGSGIAVGTILSYLPNWATAVFVIGIACYFVYTIALTGLKYDKAVQEISKKYEK
jgi:hypothetical protein